MSLPSTALPAFLCFLTFAPVSFGTEFGFDFHFYGTSEPFSRSDITYMGTNDLTGPSTLTYIGGSVAGCAPATITASIAFDNTWVFGPDGGGSSPSCGSLFGNVVGFAFYVTDPLSLGGTATNSAGRVIAQSNGGAVVLYGPGTLTISEGQGPGPTPVPEPRSLLLLPSGFSVLGLTRLRGSLSRRQKRCEQNWQKRKEELL
jgi:hypothetical protein